MKYFFYLILVVILGMSIASCKTEGCTDSLSENFNPDADTDDGSCFYARENFLGAYTAVSVCDGYSYEYTYTITESNSGINSIVFNNLLDYSYNINGVVTGDGVAINDSMDDYVFSGTGSIVNNTLSISITMTENGYGLICNISANRQ